MYISYQQMNLERYNRSYEEFVESIDDEVDTKLSYIRKECVREFIDRLNKREKEWETTFLELLEKSREDDIEPTPSNTQSGDTLPFITSLFSKSESPQTINLTTTNAFSNSLASKENKPISENTTPVIQKDKPATVQILTVPEPKLEESVKPIVTTKNDEVKNDPHFSNLLPLKEFVRVQELLEENRKSFVELNTNQSLKAFKNELNLFIRTQINSISNSDTQHLDTKTKLLTNLFTGKGVSFQDKFIDASKHPQGQLFSIDLAAQTFVTVGLRLVNSVPAIAKSMATVITGIVNNNLPLFKDLIVGHLQEQCPYLIPMYPSLEDFSKEASNQRDVKHKIACGYSYDSKTQTLESEEKYLNRMRSMALMYACILIQGHQQQAWTWLAAFLSLKPQPVITATILQAFLQETSKKLSSTYGRQYKKMIDFIRDHYIAMIDDITPKTGDRQSLIKLKNLLSDDSNLIAGPTMSSIFGAIRFG